MIMKYNTAIGLIVLLSLAQIALILQGILPPLSDNTPGNILFWLAKQAVVAYAIWTNARSGLRSSFTAGLAVSIVGLLVMYLAAAVYVGDAWNPVLGVQAENLGQSLLVLSVTLIVNIAINVVIVGIIALAAKKLSKRR